MTKKLRIAAGVAAAMALCACSPKTGAAAPSADAAKPAATPALQAAAPVVSVSACTPSQKTTLSLTAADAKDTLEVSALGADCSEAVIVRVLRRADGKALWSRADLAKETFAFAGAQESKQTPEQGVKELMASWLKNLQATTTAEMPDWPAGKTHPEIPGGLDFRTPLDRADYLELRKKKLPMLCHEYGPNQRVCVVYYADGDGFAREVLTLSS